jgi:hypothetical protein
MSVRHLLQNYSGAALSNKLNKGIFCCPSVQKDFRFVPSRSEKIAHKSYSCVFLVWMYSSVCYSEEIMYFGLQLFERSAAREIF